MARAKEDGREGRAAERVDGTGDTWRYFSTSGRGFHRARVLPCIWICLGSEACPFPK